MQNEISIWKSLMVHFCYCNILTNEYLQWSSFSAIKLAQPNIFNSRPWGYSQIKYSRSGQRCLFKAQRITLSTSISKSWAANLHLMDLQRLPSLKGFHSKISCIYIFLQIYSWKIHCWILCKMQNPKNNVFSLLLICVDDKLLSLLCQWQILTKGEHDKILSWTSVP